MSSDALPLWPLRRTADAMAVLARQMGWRLPAAVSAPPPIHPSNMRLSRAVAEGGWCLRPFGMLMVDSFSSSCGVECASGPGSLALRSAGVEGLLPLSVPPAASSSSSSWSSGKRVEASSTERASSSASPVDWDACEALLDRVENVAGSSAAVALLTLADPHRPSIPDFALACLVGEVDKAGWLRSGVGTAAGTPLDPWRRACLEKP